MLNLLHIGPGVHAIGLDVCDIALIFLLHGFVAFDVGHEICLIRALDDDLSDFLGRHDLLDLGFLLEPLLNDLAD